MSKLDPRLIKEMEKVLKESGNKEIPVFVHYKKGADLSKLKVEGFNLQKVFKDIEAVSGTITAASIQQLAASGDVEIIELDAEAEAFRTQENDG